MSLVVGIALPLRAESEPQIDVTIGNLELQQGGSGYLLDVIISSDPGTESSPLPQAVLDNFSAEFNITNNNPNSSTQLAFIGSPTDPSYPADPQLSDPRYVFYNNSLFFLVRWRP